MLEWVKTLGPLIASLPVAAVVIALLFRRPISDLLVSAVRERSLKSLKATFGKVSVEWTFFEQVVVENKRSSQEIDDLMPRTEKLAKQIETGDTAEALRELTQIRSSVSRLATANNNISVALTAIGFSGGELTISKPSLALTENPPSAED